MAKRINISVPDEFDIDRWREINPRLNISRICQNALSSAHKRSIKMSNLSPQDYIELRRRRNELMTKEELILKLRRSKAERDLDIEFGLL